MRKPPRVIAERLWQEFKHEAARLTIKAKQARRLDAILPLVEAQSLEELWQRLGKQSLLLPLEFKAESPQSALSASMIAREINRLTNPARQALAREVNLLGSGQRSLGAKIDWHQDIKTGFRWPPAYFRSIEYNNLDRPSDVKLAWELSRVQWLLPLGQMWLLTHDETYALAVRDILWDWIKENPYGGSVNWACTMEVALRIFSWVWLFEACHQAKSWQDKAFQGAFLTSLYGHGEFCEAHIEKSDVNGNHYTADAAGMVVAGLFWRQGKHPQRWASNGWRILEAEITTQVTPDGVDYEASIPYHRLVCELFTFPALLRQRLSLPISAVYNQRLEAMANFIAYYTPPATGLAPLIGDADDARALPLGGQGLNDHRYLIGIVAHVTKSISLESKANVGDKSEAWWCLGNQAYEELPLKTVQPITSQSFPEGGFYCLTDGGLNHIIMDAGPIGLAGRGGHGHNDCLAFEAVLAGQKLFSDCGAYLYTASMQERNLFRSTAYHNTPQIGTEEINRFIRADYLWNMHYDAKPEVIDWRASAEKASVTARHTGYQRLVNPVTIERMLSADFRYAGLCCYDRFITKGEGFSHSITIPLHLDPQVRASLGETSHTHGEIILDCGEITYLLRWEAEAPVTTSWKVSIEQARISPSYGVVQASHKLIWHWHPPSVPVDTPPALRWYCAPQASLAQFIESMGKG